MGLTQGVPQVARSDGSGRLRHSTISVDYFTASPINSRIFAGIDREFQQILLLIVGNFQILMNLIETLSLRKFEQFR